MGEKDWEIELKDALEYNKDLAVQLEVALKEMLLIRYLTIFVAVTVCVLIISLVFL